LVLKEPTHMAKLGLQARVVGPVLAEKATIVLAIVKQVFRSIALLEVSVALLASPGEELTAGLERWAPRVSEEVIIAMLQLELGGPLLVDCRVIEEESSILHE